MAATSGLGILLGFSLLVVGSWKKVNLIAVTLAASAVIALLSGLTVVKTWSGPYMDGFKSFAGGYLLLFCFGALFGKIVEDSGAGWRLANTIAGKAGNRGALIAFTMVTLLLLYGGVSIFVIVFFLLPIGKNLFVRLRIPWSMFPGIAMIGTIPAVGMLPGTLQILNIIPTRYFGTSLTAGAGVGLFAAIVYLILAVLYTKLILKNSEDKYDLEEFSLSKAASMDEKIMESKAPGAITSIIPIALALGLINLLKIDII